MNDAPSRFEDAVALAAAERFPLQGAGGERLETLSRSQLVFSLRRAFIMGVEAHDRVVALAGRAVGDACGPDGPQGMLGDES